MSEELLQRDLLKNPAKIGKWDFYNIGATSIKALKEYNIIRNVDYGDVEKKKVDGIIVLRKNVVAVIEYKKPSEFNTKAKQDKAIKQEIEVAQKLGCKILIATDTKETVWVNAFTGKRIKDEKGHELKINFNPKDEKITALIEKISYSINELSNEIKPQKLVNPTDLAKQIWQDIWSVSGESPTNCLYSFVELFIFKYLSDLGVLGQGINFDHLMERFSYDIENPDEEALEYYAKNIRPKIKELFPKNLTDNTTIINGTVFINKDQQAVKGYSTVFKKVLIRFKNYGKLEHIDYDFKSHLFESFLKEGISKKNLGQYFTPLKVVRAVVEMAKDNIQKGIKICDPACGVGKFLLEPIVTKLDYFYDITKNGIDSKITIHGFDKGFDNEEQKTIILAKANMLIYFSDLIKDNPGLTKDFARLFNESFTLKTNSILGTLSAPIEEEYDLILTNPPYVTSGSSNLKEEIKKDGTLKDYYKINALGIEGLFMEWIVKALKPGGKAFVVIPDGMLNRQNDKNLRKYVLEECTIDGLISLPLNTFFTTNKKTYILAITKKIDKKQAQKEPVFSYLVSEIGETRDINRFDIDQNDLDEGVTLYSFFKGNKQSFAKINTDKRCKIVPFDFFKDNIEKNWVIDKLWSEEEKIELGIVEKTESVTLLDFSSIIEDVATAIKGFQKEVKELAEKKKKSEVKYKSFKLKELFHIERGISKYTKKYGNTHKGDYPVYSASNREALTFIDSFDYNGKFLTWATNGFAGYVKVISGKFSINADRGLLKPKKEEINILYVKHKIEPVLRGLAKGRKGEKGEDEFTKVYPSMIEDIAIEMPVDKNGKLEEKIQKIIAEKYATVEDIKSKILSYDKQVEKLNIEIEHDVNYNEIVLGDYFNFKKGTNEFNRAKIEKQKGEYPVYSGQTQNDGIIGYANRFQYNGRFIRITTVGVNAGYVDIINGKFSLAQNNGILVGSNKYSEKNIDIDYIITQLQSQTITLTKGDVHQKSLLKGDIEKIILFVPVNSNGEFDLIKQKQIAEKYKKIEQIKKSFSEELRKIVNSEIDFE